MEDCGWWECVDELGGIELSTELEIGIKVGVKGIIGVCRVCLKIISL